MNIFQKLSDKELYSICKKCGAAVLTARRKFGGLLPEVHRREMSAQMKGGSWVQKKGFHDIYEFAAKLAGMSRPLVDEVLRLARRLEDKPILRDALVNGEVSVNKLARVVSIATVENQEELLGKVKSLSNRALEVYVKDYKRANGLGGEADGLLANGLLEPQMARISDSLQKPQSGQTSLHVRNENADIWHKEAIEKTASRQGGHAMTTATGQPGPCVRNMNAIIGPTEAIVKQLPVNLDADIAKELSEMMEKGIDVNELLREFLREKKEKHEREKAEVVKKQMRERDDRATIGYPAKRHVPAVIRKIVIAEFGDRCSAPGCGKIAENLHHEKGFAKGQCHDPRYLKPLCKGHHELVHAGAGGAGGHRELAHAKWKIP